MLDNKITSNSVEKSDNNFGFSACAKGQIVSECNNEIIDFPKYHQNFLIDFCRGRFYRLVICFDYSQGNSTQVSA